MSINVYLCGHPDICTFHIFLLHSDNHPNSVSPTGFNPGIHKKLPNPKSDSLQGKTDH
jgi:hypothetical protein